MSVDDVTVPRDRLLLVGTTAQDTQIFIGDKEITNITQRVELELDARDMRIAKVILTILPRDGLELALPIQTVFAFLPAAGVVWRQIRAEDGSCIFRCEHDGS